MTRRLGPHALLRLLLVAIWMPCARAQAVIHVSPGGDDRWRGASAVSAKGDGPVATLERAFALARSLKVGGEQTVAHGITILVHGGRYELAAALHLGPEDSGAPGAPLVIKSAGDGPVVFTGARIITGFHPVSDVEALRRIPTQARAHVLEADLPAQGFTNLGHFETIGYGRPIQAGWADLIFEGDLMPIARWPNQGFGIVAGIPDGPQGRRINLKGPNLSAWAQEPDVWADGFWVQDWAEFHLPVSSVNPAAGIITFAEAPAHYGMKSGQRCFFYNLLCELDAPGEWYVDRRAGKLYFWPPAQIKPKSVELTLAPELLRMDGASHIEVEGIAFEGARATAITVSGGDDVWFVGCAFHAMDGRAVNLSASNSGLTACRASQLGAGAFSLSGGDRETLTSGGQSVLGCRIEDWGRWIPDYEPAITVEGVGARIAYNQIQNGPSQAIIFWGNEHRIEYNDISRVAGGMGDVGAIYTGRDWTARGNVIRFNYLHDIQSPYGYGANGIYIDDQGSGTTIESNVFYRVTHAVFLGGGRDNSVKGNLFVESSPAVHLDARGLTWQKAGSLDPQGIWQTRLNAVPYQSPLYAQRYPGLADILRDNPGAPKRNVISGNICVRGKWEDILPVALPGAVQGDNRVDGTQKLLNGLRDMPLPIQFVITGRYPDIPKGFAPIPLAMIGPKGWVQAVGQKP